ncbi:N-acetylmuramoyl-L-alanine amidase family protein [Moheibacter sp.]|uniref:N-acetylmuramoyl-L-alanine amidase family protein n=1 Tax=Moheibacter sp. TaxID=1965316 RepID=UPI003C781F60
MRLLRINKQILLAFLFILFSGMNSFAQSKQNFTIVIDPGHGGKDSGARGVVEDEKSIVLDVSLRFGKMIEQNYKDVKVVYTRKTDVFLELWERTQIANRNHANLFVSIHCNAANNRSAYGTETFVMGLSRSQETMDVSKRENSVILLEDNQEKYQKFDPNDPEAVIAFDIMFSAYKDQSLNFAKYVEDEFVRNGRSSRGVKQANFHVLRTNASPAVLVELGFISNQDEGSYLATEQGKQKMTQSLFEAFEKFKKEFDRKTRPQEDEKPKEVEKPVAGKTYKIQILVSKNKYGPSATQLNGLTGVEVVQVGDVYKYYYGNTNLASERDELLAYAKRKGFKDAFVAEFVNNEKLQGNQNYRIQFLASNKRYRDRDNKFGGLKNVLRVKKGNMNLYFYGSTKTYEEALKDLKTAQDRGFKSAFIVTFEGEKLIE